MVFSDAQRGLILLNAIPKEWATVTQIYSQANQTLATTTFIGVWDAIMAEYEQISRPSTIATHHISVVKCKGKSPTFTEQTQTKSAPPCSKASSDAPSQGAPSKKQRGGKGKGKAWAHAIVSSALVPPSVTKRLQETHHVVALVPAPTSAPIVASTVVGGPLHAPIT